MIQIFVASLAATALPTVPPTATAKEAAYLLREPDVPALVVVDATETVVGMVTEADIVALVATESTQLPVSGFMSNPVATVTPETSVHTAADTMQEVGVKHLPVVKNGVYHGLLSVDDIAPYVSRHRLDIVWKGDSFRAPEGTTPQPAD
ncbi:CBS domain-containing protein [Haladaptatus sp. DJG-WS-42]|uniref:CBS domain-containing protein n=1 Tax=Haladaptatus sp. DJG-WS-42 TaxID=3120516 RepID=UPI0030CF1859